MSRSPRELLPGYCYHITMRCNNRDFHLTHRTNRELLLTILHKARRKYEFKLYGLCIMSNHVHYLLEPQHPEDLPKIMHWINWYSAMTFNALLKRKGHFWEQRYSCSGFPMSDQRRALCTLRYIHANPKAAQMQTRYFYDFSNYGSYERLTDDGLTEWHPAFLELGVTLDDCARSYQRFCQRYHPREKTPSQNVWGSKWLAEIAAIKLRHPKRSRPAPGQLKLLSMSSAPLCTLLQPELAAIVMTFVQANRVA